MGRFERQIILPELGREGQQKLQSARVLVVGAGGLGCPALLYLAAAGVGSIGIADGDRVAISNLNRQVLFGLNDVGNPKASVAKHYINERYPDIQIEAYDRYFLAKDLVEILPGYDLLIDASDNFATRYMLNDAAALFEKPLVYGAVYKYEGQVALFCAGEGSANYRDLYPHMPEPGEVPGCAEAGVIGVLSGIIGTMQAAEAVKWITGIGKTLVNKVLFYNLAEQSFYDIGLTSSDEAQKRRPATTEAFLKTDYAFECVSGIDIGWNAAMLMAEQKPSVFIDIRELYEMPRWTNTECLEIPFSQLIQKKNSVFDSKSIFLFCQHGIRSQPAAVELRKVLKRDNVYSVTGGVKHPDSPVK